MPRNFEEDTKGTTKAAAAAPKVARAAAPTPTVPPPRAAPAARPAGRPAAPSRTADRQSTFGSAGYEERKRMRAERAPGTVRGEQLVREQELADLAPFLTRLERVEKLRKDRQIGPKEQFYYSAPGSETRISPFPRPGAEMYSADFPVRGVGKGGPSGPTKTYAVNVISPTKDELDIPIVGARAAKNIGDRYREAAREYDRALSAVEQKRQDPYTGRADIQALAQDARSKLQRVADLRASLREYGWGFDEVSELE
jgi:hypothetical protein